MTKKDRKSCLNAEKDDLGKRIAFEAPVSWSKHTTRNAFNRVVLFIPGH